MIICAAGDIHGAIEQLYDDVLAFEESLGVRFEWVLHVGDFGVWPDPNRVDGATKRHDGAGDFPAWWLGQRAAPRRTLFIKGNHEDFVWLDAQPRSEILPNLFYLSNGLTFELGGISVGGVGGCHGPSNFERRSRDLHGAAKRHYTREDIGNLIAAGPVDVLLTHDAPAGVMFERHRRGLNWASEAMGLDDLVRGVRPRVCFFGHHHTRVHSELEGVPCIGLNKVRMPGNLVAIEIAERGRAWTLLGEWPSPGTSVLGRDQTGSRS
jgi:predicted phosphohydrolase